MVVVIVVDGAIEKDEDEVEDGTIDVVSGTVVVDAVVVRTDIVDDTTVHVVVVVELEDGVGRTTEVD